MERTWLALGSILAFLAVAGGAFGAHLLRDRLDETALATFETAVRYQMYHALALLAVGLLAGRGLPGVTLSGWLFVAGIVLFSGSLYLLTFTGVRQFGAITPFGGGAFLAGWVVLAFTVARGQ